MDFLSKGAIFVIWLSLVLWGHKINQMRVSILNWKIILTKSVSIKLSFVGSLLLSLPSYAQFEPYLPQEFEQEAFAFLRWHTPKGYQTGATRGHPLESFCSDSELFPTHPGQELKQYHTYQVAKFDPCRLSPKSILCRVTDVPKRKCLLADELHFVILSDTYELVCSGESKGWVRALKKVSFVRREENMGTLFSPGRTLYPRSKGPFPGDMWVGPTFSVGGGEFIGYWPIAQEELDELPKLINKALSESHELVGRIFVPRDWDPLDLQPFHEGWDQVELSLPGQSLPHELEVFWGL